LVKRRAFLKLLSFFGLLSLIPKSLYSKESGDNLSKNSNSTSDAKRLGVDAQGFSHVYLCSGFSPEENTRKAIQAFGGVNTIVDKDSVVVIKPNSQWWHQGATNTNAIKGFIDELLSRSIRLPQPIHSASIIFRSGKQI